MQFTWRWDRKFLFMQGIIKHLRFPRGSWSFRRRSGFGLVLTYEPFWVQLFSEIMLQDRTAFNFRKRSPSGEGLGPVGTEPGFLSSLKGTFKACLNINRSCPVSTSLAKVEDLILLEPSWHPVHTNDLIVKIDDADDPTSRVWSDKKTWSTWRSLSATGETRLSGGKIGALQQGQV